MDRPCDYIRVTSSWNQTRNILHLFSMFLNAVQWESSVSHYCGSGSQQTGWVWSSMQGGCFHLSPNATVKAWATGAAKFCCFPCIEQKPLWCDLELASNPQDGPAFSVLGDIIQTQMFWESSSLCFIHRAFSLDYRKAEILVVFMCGFSMLEACWSVSLQDEGISLPLRASLLFEL